MASPVANKPSTGSDNGNIVTQAGVILPDDVLEKLYQSYSLKQKRAGLSCFLVTSILFDIWAIFIPQGQSWESIAVVSIFLILNTLLLAFLHLCNNSQWNSIKSLAWTVAPHIAWCLAILQLSLQLFLQETITPRDSLGWAVLLNFLVYITLPVFLKFVGIIFGASSFIIYMIVIIILSNKDDFFLEQQIANCLLISVASVIGILCYFLGEAKHRRAFSEAKQSLEVKMLIEEQSAEQESLLLSVLPEHVAVKMRQDLGSNSSEQFKKIYMSRHENVSILYADIVGFTAISSTYSASELVKILNELFARFDRLSEKYNQLRIKILGDCYYCISGAPVERADHAVLCVHMGLSMVKAIKYVQQKTNSPVDMRVGIHTGAVLAGILGQKQFEYDVYSKDVELANKMESSGMAGRVHISEKTLSFLNGEFEVEPAYGEKREETLRVAGLKTYFITKVIKPFNGVINESNGNTSKIDIESDGPSEIIRDELESKCTSPGGKDEEAHVGMYDEAAENFKQRLRKELVARDGHEELSKNVSLTLAFKDKHLESAYSSHREPNSSVPMLGALFVQALAVIYTFVILPRTLIHFGILLLPLAIVAIVVVMSVAESFPGIFSTAYIEKSKRMNDCVWIRRSAAIIMILALGTSNILDMYVVSQQMSEGFTFRNASFVTIDMKPSTACLFPSYYSNFAVLILISTAIIAQLSHLAKAILMILITGGHCYMNIVELEKVFHFEELQQLNTETALRVRLSALLLAVTIALCVFSRHIDHADRVIFMWKTEVSDQKEKAADMRHRNKLLVYNILPVHVAEHFMRNKKRSHDELYSQSYAEVGVLFASMPNFSDFYSEESVNNQGLECLRFLNEVISDFDALLEVPKFQDIIKIKTIGSTYMAASGLNPTKEIKSDDPLTVRWKHLDMLVEFALELKKALQGINEQSFNHFVLKMGINHGPITAGVIGARKPHYDIWGNTVNVASRMESTGKAGAIQVTQETRQILEQFGYTFIERGLVMVKGKGELLTFYLQGKVAIPMPPPKAPTTTETEPNEIQMSTTTESKQLSESPSLVKNISTESPAHLTSVSSSTASPNSVRLNQEYVDKQNPTTVTVIDNDFDLDTTRNNKVVTNTNNFDVVNNGDDADAQTPLLSSQNTNTTTNAVDSNHFSIDEKDALLENAN